MRQFFIFLCIVFGFFGCSKIPEPTATPTQVNAWAPIIADENSVAYLTDAGLEVWSQDERHLLDIVRKPDVFVFSPQGDSLLLAYNSDTGVQVYFYDFAHALNRLLFTQRSTLVHMAYSPLGTQVALVFADSDSEDHTTRSLRTSVYSFNTGDLQLLQEDSAYPSWSDDGRFFVYTVYKNRAYTSGSTFFSVVSADGVFENEQLLIPDGIASVFARNDLYYIGHSGKGLNLYRFNVLSRTSSLAREFNFSTENSTGDYLHISPDKQSLLWLRASQKTIFNMDTWLVPLDDAVNTREILPQSQSVVWYSNDKILYQPSFEKDKQQFDTIYASSAPFLESSPFENDAPAMLPVSFQSTQSQISFFLHYLTLKQ